MGSVRLFVIKILVLSLIFLWWGGQTASHAETDPMAQLRQTVDEILTLLNNPDLAKPENREKKQERVMEKVRSRFNFNEMSKLTLARHWRDLSAAEQDRFVGLFSELLKNTYIRRIESYSQKDVRVVFKDHAIQDGKAVVASVVHTENAETPITYRLKQENGEWKVYDVVIEGVSLVRNYRSQFGRIMEKERFAGLIRRMEEKIKTGEPVEQ